MSHRKFTYALPWAHYSKKLIQKIECPRYGGCFTAEEAKERGVRLVFSRQNAEGDSACLYLLVDESDGVIADAKFQVFGHSALIGAAEAACEILMRKNYDQALKISADLIDKQCRDKPDLSAFPEESFSCLNLVLDAIEGAAIQCLDIPFATAYVPLPLEAQRELGEYPDWDVLTREQKIAVLEEVIVKEIRPYIELDAGGIQILDLIDGKELIIAYEGACTSCHSATGATLNAIQEILKTRVHPSLTVIPDASFLRNL